MKHSCSRFYINPPDRAKKQCVGIPIFDVESMVVDPNTFKELPAGEVGEIPTRGPQVFKGYWNNPEATRNAFVDIDGKQWFRTGDLGRVDEDGYFLITKGVVLTKGVVFGFFSITAGIAALPAPTRWQR